MDSSLEGEIVIMRMNKFKILGLSALLLGLAVQVQAADTLRVKSWPLYFNGVGTRASDGSYSHDDSLLQEEYWLNLMKYKLWGTTGIEVEHGNIIIGDNVGYNGTAKGDFSMKHNNHHFGGPTIVGGNLTIIDSHEDKFTKGPVRVLGNLQISTTDQDVVEGDWCVEDTLKAQYNANDVTKFVTLDTTGKFYNDLYTGPNKGGNYSACPASVPQVERDMAVPIWPEPASWSNFESITMNSTDPGEIYIIHVPPEDVEKNGYGTYDKYYQNISIGVGGESLGKKLIVLMPPGGRITRIFSRDGFAFTNGVNDLQIVIAYVKPEVEFKDGKWDVALPEADPNNPRKPKNGQSWEFKDADKMEFVSNKDYAGNLMFYTKKDIVWNYWKDASFVGSWFTTGTMKVGGHFKLAGQLIAGKLEFTNDVSGDFRYVPIDPPEIDPTIFAKDYVYWEGDTLETIPITLSKIPQTNVTFDYCYSFINPCTFGESLCAENADLNIDNPDPRDPQRKLPICGADTGHAIIPKGSLAATDTAFMPIINVKKDGLEENDEYLKMHIINLAGAVVKYNGNTYFDGNISVNIRLGDRDRSNDPPVFVCEDEDGNPIDCDSLLKVAENDAGAKAGKVKATDKEDEQVTYALGGQYRANGVEDVNIFEIDENTGVVKLKAGVQVNYEEDQYFGVDIMAKDEKHVTVKSFRVSVRDVNEKPIIVGNTDLDAVNNKTYNAEEDLADGDIIGKVVVGDIDSLHRETTEEKFRDNIVKAVDGDTNIFTVDSRKNIVVLHGDSLDYEKDSVYTLLIRAEDRNDPTLFDTMTVTIRIIDVNDPPHFDTTHVDIVIPPPDPTDPGSDPDTTKNLISLDRNKKGSVEENNPANVIVGAVKATCSDTLKTLIYEIVKDTSGLFTIDPKTGVVVVKDPMVFDYERVNEYEITVKVSDGVDAGSGFTADGVKVQTAERPVIIRVIDVNEAPEIAKQEFHIDENQPAGSEVDGHLVSADPDTLNHNFSVSTYKALSGDTLLFQVNEDGSIVTKTKLDYEKYAATGDTVFSLVVEVKNVLGSDGGYATESTALWDTATVTIILRDVNEPPEILTDTVRVEENSKGGTVVDTIESVDPENPNEKITYTQIGTSDFNVSEDGVITVKDGAKLDYESTPILKITVEVSDSEGHKDRKEIIVKVEDVNEPPTIRDQIVTFLESDSIGTTKGPLVADDPDTDPKNRDLKFSLVGDPVTFDVLEDGKVKLLDSLDYEKDSVYYITVRVTDGDYSDTAKITIRIGNVIEYSEVKITRAENPDSVWSEPDTLYVNKEDLDFCWSQGIKGRDNAKEFCADTTLTPGKNVIKRTYKDPTTDNPGTATLIVYYSNAVPEVTLSKEHDPEFKGSIYTIVEQVKEKDSTTFYVNKLKNEVTVTVKDSAANNNSSFTINLELGTVSIPSKYYTTMSEIADGILPLNESAKGAKRSEVNGEKIAVSYTEIVNGNEVTVTYYTDMKGNIIKGESGEEEMTVSYTKVIDGKTVTISFQANATTGSLIESKDGGYYNIGYDYIDSKKNSVHLSYDVDEKGKVIKNASGDIAYDVSYSYVNKFGNAAERSVHIVLDTKPPMVWIKSPVTDEVLTSNMAEVVWYVSVTGDSADYALMDTLNIQGLEKGGNTIIRYFIDKAGNIAGDTVYVIMKNAKDIEIAVEKPVTLVTADKVAEYYTEENTPAKKQTFAVSIANPSTGDEKETLVGGGFKTKKGSGNTPYPSKKGHLGPTLGFDVKLPVYKPAQDGNTGSVSGLATLDDLVGKDGTISLDGLDAAGGEKLSVEKYVQEYCTADFASTYSRNDLSAATLYDSKMEVKIWVFTTLGTFVDYYKFTQDMNDPDYVNDAGLLKMYFELKPDKDGYVHTENGKAYATGAYIFRTEVTIKSTLNCTLPPVNDSSNLQTMGAVIKTSDDLTKSFGYRRPDSKK